ncbi:MarP family serine protease [Conexibacter sp. W3-3-2]|uniref:MarP family serine protease n=1 Tax=Conexibacter sp. W3-3-2 TaxID=2675227 RepID=UPI0012B82C9C|nr:MarP family serine protease [Conexibacter sp. W3-3-2]MTD46992.1 MarP family serine protease [Conexibacter sp. W3-3-2]
MTTIDVIILGLTVLMAAFGWRQGFVVGALSLAGFVVGAIIGTRLGPQLLSEGSSSPYAPIFGMGGALLGGAILSTGLEGLGWRLRQGLRLPGLAAVDGLLGAALAACVALGISWVAGAVALQTPGARELRADIQRSAILKELNAVLPPSGPLLNALARFDPFPQLDGPAPQVPAPRAAIARDPQVRAAAASVVRVVGTACGLGVTGSGWVASDGIVVTNAHVVAGQEDTAVQRRGEGEKLDAEVIGFSARDDIAILRVPGLGAPALPIADEAPRGRAGAVLGFPENGPYDVRAARLGETERVLSPDAYGRGPIRRTITSFRGTVRPGNSGGPLVDARGRVAATVFASTRGSSPRGGFAVPNDIVRDLLRGADGPVGTGPCAP